MSAVLREDAEARAAVGRVAAAGAAGTGAVFLVVAPDGDVLAQAGTAPPAAVDACLAEARAAALPADGAPPGGAWERQLPDGSVHAGLVVLEAGDAVAVVAACGWREADRPEPAALPAVPSARVSAALAAAAETLVALARAARLARVAGIGLDAAEGEGFRALFESAPEAMYLHDMQGRFVDGNRAAEALLGCPRTEVIGKNLLQMGLFDGAALPRVAAALAQNLLGRAAGPDEYLLHRPDGTRIEVEARSYPVLVGGRRLVLGSVRDVGAWRRAGERLRASEEQFRALVENSPDVVMRFDGAGRHLYVSPAVRSLLPFAPEAMVGRTHRELDLPPALCDFWEERIQGVLRTGRPLETEFSIDGPRGPLVVDWRLYPEFDAGGRTATVLAVARDVTESRQAARAYRDLFDTMLEGFALHEIVLDAAGLPVDYRFLAVNPAFERLAGLAASALVGRTVREVLPDTEDSWIARYGQVALTGEAAEFEDWSRELGRWFHVRAHRPAPRQFAVLVTDVTAAREAADRLAASEEKYRALVESANSIILRMDEEGVLQYVNEYGLAFFGWSAEELVGRNVVGSIVPPTESTGRDLGALIRDLARDPARYRSNVNENVRRDGTRAWISWSNRVVASGPGHLDLLCVGNDVSAQYVAEGALRASEAQYRALVENINDVVWMMDTALHTVFVTPSIRRLTGYDVGEHLAQTLEERFTPVSAALARRRYAEILPVVRAARPGEDFSFREDFEYRRKDGGTVWATVSVRPRFDKDGNFAGIQGTSVDVDARRRAEQALAAGGEALARVAAHLLALGEDFQANVDGLVALAGELCGADCALYSRLEGAELHSVGRWRAPSGFDPRFQAAGTPCGEVACGPDGPVAIQDLAATAFADTDPHVRGFGLRAYLGHRVHDGDLVGSLCVVYGDPRAPGPNEPRLLAVLAAALGAEERRRRARETRRELEGQLRHEQKLSAVGTLASGVAHEINNPLMGMINLAQLSIDRLAPLGAPAGVPSAEAARLAAEAAAFLGDAIHEGTRIAAIVRNLLAFSRQDQAVWTAENPADLVDGILSLTNRLFEKHEIAIAVEVPRALPPVRCSAPQVQQVLLNLLTNARDALNQRWPDWHADKRIRVAGRELADGDGRWVRLAVSDQGGGIPPEAAARIFEPFFSTKPRETGTGLGLAISYGIAREHGGRLTFETEPGEGTTFCLDLPVA